MQNFNWKVFSSDKERRLLYFIQSKLDEKISNKGLKKLIEKGICKVNGKIERFASIVLKTGDIVELDQVWEKMAQEKSQKLTFKILFEDDYFIIVDKPSLFVCEDKNLHPFFANNVILVHRLDKETSGCLILAKSLAIKEKMKQIFLRQEIEKYYLAIVDGKMHQNEGKIEKKLARKKAPFGQSAFKVFDQGEPSLTFFKCLDKKENCSLVLCKIITGKTHQIRVHFLDMHHPVLGDYHYAKRFVYPKHVHRLLLHAVSLSFIHPITNKKIEVTAELPNDFLSFFNIDIAKIGFDL
ncbi:MAG: RluA family pseudouridine synthase [Chlamydiae bacterium]|nr:RluA family pseudouridine synthase [Chlamydiota bacterium]